LGFLEGCFILSIVQDYCQNLGWRVRLIFKITLHIKDLPLLNLFKQYFGVGNVTNHGSSSSFRVDSIKELHVIVNHFNKLPLKTQKGADFILFVKAPQPPGLRPGGL
jgi:hypothetical protein